MNFLIAVFRWLMDSYKDTAEPLPPFGGCLDPIHPLWHTSFLVVLPYPPSPSLFTICSYGTSIACFYRIYEFAVIHDDIRFRNEIEYFCHQQWPIALLPDPCDSGRGRAALIAALTHILCASFTDRIKKGLPRGAPVYIKDFDEMRARPRIWKMPDSAAGTPATYRR
ncbi:hypothetical protein MVEN_01376900 [Mycena venus]|uniref:Uncharacterized protein n=1 Tax=Mycena venus TaxID=2733690 RepID=A0A8H6XW20_9AGAR|nr:hypothetical protein MVEN_01376900 [Mycena venus]